MQKNSKKAVIFGAGNIGRGFIAPLFSFDGWRVTFIDVALPVVEKINADGRYPLNIVSDENTVTLSVENVSAVDGNDADATVKALVECDIAATCVGAKAIKYILPNFVSAVKKRTAEKRPPLNLLICENLMDADSFIRGLLKDMLTEEELCGVGLVETSVGRMVPVPKAKGEGENPLAISVEEYGVLPVDRDAFKGEVLEVQNIVPFSPFRYYVERKLYIHNMGHAVCAYLGDVLYGDEYICDSISRPEIRLAVQNAMIESALALSKKYGADFEPLMEHVWDLLGRFKNRALGDTCARVGGDIPRKLANSDRLIGAAKNILESGKSPVYVCVGAAAALYKYMRENKCEEQNAKTVFLSLTSLDKDSPITNHTLEFYRLFEEKKELCEILNFADKMKKRESGMIV